MKTNSVVIVFIAVLIVGVTVLHPPNRWFEDGAKLAPIKGDFQSISSALKTYHKNTGDYPTTNQGLMALVTRPETLPEESDWEATPPRFPPIPGRTNTDTADFRTPLPDPSNSAASARMVSRAMKTIACRNDRLVPKNLAV